MKIAYTGWTWLIHHQDNQRYEFEQFLKEVADLGYDAVENFAFITKYFENAAQAVKELLSKYGLAVVCLYHHFSDDPEWTTRAVDMSISKQIEQPTKPPGGHVAGSALRPSLDRGYPATQVVQQDWPAVPGLQFGGLQHPMPTRPLQRKNDLQPTLIRSW